MSRIVMIAVALSLLVGVRVARAQADDDESLLAQVKQLAAQGQNAQTAQQVDQYVDANKDTINAILKGYAAYLKQMQAASNEEGSDGAGTGAVQTSGTATAARNAGATPQAQTNGERQARAQNTTATQDPGGLQVSSGLQLSSGLQTSHLAGYPALPAAEPVSSVTVLTADQMAYAAKVRKENVERKQSLMAHPAGYTY
jgi:hypothetical protein